MKKNRYVSRQWLNKPSSPSTGSCVAYCGESSWDPKTRMAFFEVSDCHNSARLHITELDSKDDFVCKLRILAKSAEDFANWLENNKKCLKNK